MNFSSTDLSQKGWEVIAAGIRDGAPLERIRIRSATAVWPYATCRPQELFLRDVEASAIVVLDADLHGPSLVDSPPHRGVRPGLDRPRRHRQDVSASIVRRFGEPYRGCSVASGTVFEMLLTVLHTRNSALRHAGLGRRAKPGARAGCRPHRASQRPDPTPAGARHRKCSKRLTAFSTLVRRVLRRNKDALGAVVEAAADQVTVFIAL